MTKYVVGWVLGLGLLASCQRHREVKVEIEHVQQARVNTAAVVQDLERRLQSARREVIELEEKLLLASQGVTDEVVAERQELMQAPQDQGAGVRNEATSAQEQTSGHNAHMAADEPGRQTTEPLDVDAQVYTEAVLPPTPANARRQDERESLERVIVAGRDAPVPAKRRAGQRR